MRYKYKIIAVTALLVSMLQAGCTVKEDRGDCPCYVSVMVDTDEPCDVGFFTTDGTLMAQKQMSAEELRSGENWTKIQKVGFFYVVVYQECGNMSLTSCRMLSCLAGKQSEKVFTASIASHTDDEENVLVEGSLHKQYVAFKVRFTNTNIEGFPFFAEVEGSSDVLDILTVKPVEHYFRYGKTIDKVDRSVAFRTLRMSEEEELHLKLYRESDSSLYVDIDLNRALMKVGYDWESVDLKDVEIVIDVSQNVLTLRLDEWEEWNIDLSLI